MIINGHGGRINTEFYKKVFKLMATDYGSRINKEFYKEYIL